MKKRIVSAVCALALAVGMIGAPANGIKLFPDTAITASAGGGGFVYGNIEYYDADLEYLLTGEIGNTTVYLVDRFNNDPVNATVPGELDGHKIEMMNEDVIFTNSNLKTLTVSKNVKYVFEDPSGAQSYNRTLAAKRVTIRCYAGSAAETYAKKYGYNYTIINDNTVEDIPALKPISGRQGIKVQFAKPDSADGYALYKYNSTLKKYELCGVTRSDSMMVAGLNPGRTYLFAAKAYKTIGGKNYWSTNWTTQYASTLPENVTGVKAAKIGMTAINLSWNKVSGATGYRIFRYDPEEKSFWLEDAIANGATSYTVTDLNPGTSYIFAVKAYRSINYVPYVESPSYSNVLTSTNPLNVTFAAASTAKGNCYLRWNKVAGATGYRLYYKPTASSSWQVMANVNANTDRFTKTGLTSGSTGYFTIRAIRTVYGKTYASPGFSTKAVTIK